MNFLLRTTGFLFLGIGCVGIVLPFLPTTPFFMVSAFCFAKSSEKLHNWFLGTALYKKHLDSYVQKKGMTRKTKAVVLCSITLLFGLCFLLTEGILPARIAIAAVWICHVLYFAFRVKTL